MGESAMAERCQAGAEAHVTQQLCDSLTVARLAAIILQSEGAGEFHDQPSQIRRLAEKDAALSLRVRRPEWRRLASRRARIALEDGLAEHASHLLSPAQRRALAHYIVGNVVNAVLYTLNGQMPVSPSELALAGEGE